MARADALTTLKRVAEELDFFRGRGAVVYRTARGSLDVLGALNGESGGTLAQMPLPVHVAVAVQVEEEPRLRIRSCQMEPPVGESEVVLPLSGGRVPGASSLSAEHAWTAGLVALAGAVASSSGGLSILIHSNIPLGAGQGSSTALLTAAALALVEPREAPSPLVIAQRVAAAEAVALRGSAARMPTEEIIRSLTSMSSAVSGRSMVLRYSAQPYRFVGAVPLPASARVVALDTGIRLTSRAGGWDKGPGFMEEFSTAAAMGMRIIETIYRDLGQPHTPLHGYLANTSPLLYRQYFRALLPRRMRAGDFVRTYGALAGFELESDKERIYRVRTAVDHLIAEHEHAEQFLQAMEELAEAGGAMEESERQKVLQRAGRLLLASHHSYRLRLERSCAQADWLVDRLMESGPERGVYGARITGTGAGGTVAALLARSPAATETLLEVMNAYNHLTGVMLGVVEA